MANAEESAYSITIDLLSQLIAAQLHSLAGIQSVIRRACDVNDWYLIFYVIVDWVLMFNLS